jgi:hypothetical protein
MTDFPIQGGCHCGAVRYALLAPALSVQHCHCSLCRKRYGVLSPQGAVVAKSGLKIEGEDNLTSYVGSPGYRTQFCRTCGCPLFAYEESEKTVMYLAPPTLDGGKHPGHPADNRVPYLCRLEGRMGANLRRPASIYGKQPRRNCHRHSAGRSVLTIRWSA